MPQTSGELQNFMSDEIQIWARFGLKMIITGRKAPKRPKVAEKPCRYLKIPCSGNLIVFLFPLKSYEGLSGTKKGPF